MQPYIKIPPGLIPLDHAGLGQHIETRKFLWLPHYLPLIDSHGLWDGSFRLRWLCRVTLRGYTLSGFYAFVK